MNNCAHLVGNLGDNSVVLFPQFVRRFVQTTILPGIAHLFSYTSPVSSHASSHGSPQYISGKIRGRSGHFSAFPQPLLLPLLFVYIRKDI